jgi:hypothetical protein
MAMYTYYTVKRKKRLILLRFQSIDHLKRTARETDDKRPALTPLISETVCIDGTNAEWRETLKNALPATGMLSRQ